MKKVWALLLLFAFSPLFALEECALSLEGKVGCTCGQLIDRLYERTYEDRLMSALRYDRNFFLAGLAVKTRLDRFHFDTSFSFGLPTDSCGQMDDSDWMNSSNPQMKTTYSVGDNALLQSYDGEVSLSFDFFPFNSKEESFFIISPLLSAQYQYDSFERSQAEGWYGQYNHSSDRKHHWWYEEESAHYPYTYWSEEEGRYITKKLAGISYIRHTVLLWTGFKVQSQVSKKLLLSLSAATAPFVFFSFTDTHHGSETEYAGNQYSYFQALKIECGGNVSLSKRCDLSLSATFFYLPELFGSFFVNDEYDKTYETSTRLYTFTTQAGIEFKLF